MRARKNSRLRVLSPTDLEGNSSIGSIEDIDREKQEYEESCRKRMLDTNAAAEGAFRGESVRLDSGNRRPRHCRHHKRMYHTQSSKSWFNYCVNGKKLGETAQWALWARSRDIPIIMVSGDEAACGEARTFPGNVETVPIKQGLGRNRALMCPEEESRKKITEAVKKAVKNYKKHPPFKMITPLDMRPELYRSDMADEIVSRRPDYERIDARTIRRVDNGIRKPA